MVDLNGGKDDNGKEKGKATVSKRGETVEYKGSTHGFQSGPDTVLRASGPKR